jgi:DNA-binding transcriptional LysR family regulator
MNITFRQLRVFRALAEHGSITAAAHACHVTQPTVSMQIKELSESVGLPLYEQVGKRLYLTQAGEAVLHCSRAVEAEWDSLQQTIDGLKGHTKGRLRVALASTAEYFVPRILGSFCKDYPEIDIAFEVLNRDGVVRRLRANEDDLYIMSMPPEDMQLERQAFLPNPLVIIAPESHPLAQRKRIRLAALQQESFVLREKGAGTRLATDAHFLRHDFAPTVRLELGSNETLKQSVAGGLGLGVISAHTLHSSPAAEGLAILPVVDFPIHSNWWVLHPQGKRLSPIARVFLEHLSDYAMTHQQLHDKHNN